MPTILEVHNARDVEHLFDGHDYLRPRYTFDGPSLRLIPNNDPGLLRRVFKVDGELAYCEVCTLGTALVDRVPVPHDCIIIED